MGSRLNPYLSFRDNAREAMEFYRDVFGGELAVSTFGDYGDPDAPEASLVMHAQLETPSGFLLMGSDTPPGMEHSPGGAITVSLSGDDDEALTGWWERLSDGGSVSLPFEKQMWGDVFGMCTDRFGTPWMVNLAGPENRG
jgi:PhnB protein